MATPPSEVVAYAGEVRVPGATSAAATVTLDVAAVEIAVEGAPLRMLAYRDLAVVAVNAGVGLLATGEGAGAERWLLERFGAALGPLVATLRERRLRQRLADGFVTLPDSAPVELVEYRAGEPPAEEGVALLAVDERGVTLAPLDERRPVRRVRRGAIGRVDAVPEAGGLRVEASGGGFELLRLGTAVARHRARLAELPAGAHRDSAAILARIAPDLPPGDAGPAAVALVDGRPASPADLGAAWEPVERAVLSEPTFAASYLALRDRAGGAAARRWIAIAPERPGVPDPHRAWFLVALPGNLLALELVSAGAHATYCFRTSPRAAFRGGADPADIDPAAAASVVTLVSEALVDARFLREPIALPAERLASPEGVRYRLALAALPSLAAARAAFVARLVHREETWGAALDDLIAWHATCRDDGATWPGRAAQEQQVAAAAGSAE